MFHPNTSSRIRRACSLMLMLFVLCASLAAQAQTRTIRAYIVAGQSNSEGGGTRKNPGGRNPEQDLNTIGYSHWYADFPQALIYKGHTDTGVGPGWDAMRPAYGGGYDQARHLNNQFGPELAIGHEVATHLNEQIAIIKYGQGGTSLAQFWNPDDPAINCYDKLIATIENAKQAIAPAGITLDIQGVFWTQGESDSWSLADSQNYKANLERLIAALRTRLNKPNLAFHIATLKDLPLWTHRQLIWDAQQAVADADPNAYLVHGKDLETYNDDIAHYTARGEVTLGQRFARQALYAAWGKGQVKTLRAYIVAGQSNAEGVGISRNAAAYGLNPKQDLYTIGFGHYDTTYSQTLIYKGHPDSGVGQRLDVMRATYGLGHESNPLNYHLFGPELGIARSMAHYLEEQIVLIKQSKGSTTLAVDWNPADPGTNQYDHLLVAIANATAAAQAAGVELDIQGVFWMQGESDSIALPYAQAYEANLKQFIATLRTQLGKPQLPFHLATIRDTPHWTYRQMIWNAQQAVADADPNVNWVSGRDLQAYDNDPAHYTAAGQVTLGNRFALQGLYTAWSLGQVPW
ncbi:sialate O-acetylesterase [Lysobacter sp. Root916]|uniref:sialate O-acetylesterase n=1 Tax=Lysobacter sp. Root916 TaxID=1736606 RepID=UPI0009EA5771|nr:sialate O-acetylesterase [Lysobacter sp. Root916]